MQATTELREAVALLLTDKATPKAAIAKIADYQDVIGAGTALHDLKQIPWNAKAKAEPILRDLLEKLDEEEEEETGGTARMQEIEATVLELMQTSASALLSIGQLLNEAREEFSAAKDFLGWALEKFGFKKAYVYRLMSVADAFSAEDVLAGQSINVLHKLAAMPEEVQQTARDKVESGESLTGSDVQGMQKAPEPPAEAPESGADLGQGESTPVDTKTSQSADLGADEGAPWHADTGREAPTGEPPKSVPAPENEEVARLRELVSELQAELAAARHERESKASSKGKAPMLPQFQSECLYARLGLSAEQGADPSEVRKAFRALVKAGYNSQHEAYSLLVEAKDALMQVAEAA